VLEAQASGLPVLAVDGSGASELIESGRSGCLVPSDPYALAGAIRGLARRGALQDRLATGGLLAVAQRSWERSLQQLASGYARALGREEHEGASGGASPPEVARAA
jgi:phosphatidylinositol alpha 1,6-mannosyltransferase